MARLPRMPLAAIVVIAALLTPASAAAVPPAVVGYSDIPAGHHFASGVEHLRAAGVFEGTDCADGAFCIWQPVTREHLAVWAVRVIDTGTPGPIEFTYYDDIAVTDTHAPHIHRLADLAALPDTGFYNPDGTMTRSAAAAVLAVALALPEAGPSRFTDDDDDPNETAINQFAAAGITAGCGDGTVNFCPDRITTRGEVAMFLYRATVAPLEVPDPAQLTEPECVEGAEATEACPAEPECVEGAEATEACPAEPECVEGAEATEACPVEPECVEGAEATEACPVEPECVEGAEATEACPVEPECVEGAEATEACPVEPECVEGAEATEACPAEPECAEGTERVEGACLDEPECAADERLESGECPTVPVCAVGITPVIGECVVDITCPEEEEPNVYGQCPSEHSGDYNAGGVVDPPEQWTSPVAGSIPEVHPDVPALTWTQPGYNAIEFPHERPRLTDLVAQWEQWCLSITDDSCVHALARMKLSLDYLGASQVCVLAESRLRVAVETAANAVNAQVPWELLDWHGWHNCGTVIDPLLGTPETGRANHVGWRLSDTGISLAERCRIVLPADIELESYDRTKLLAVPQQFGNDCEAWAEWVQNIPIERRFRACAASAHLAAEWMEHHHNQPEYAYPIDC